MILDELVDLDEQRLRVLDVLMRQKERIAKSYNKQAIFCLLCKYLLIDIEFSKPNHQALA